MNAKFILTAIMPLLLLSACSPSAVETASHDQHDDHGDHNHSDNDHAHEDTDEHDHEDAEGRTHITAEMQRALGITTAIAGPVSMQELLSVYGQVQTNTDKVTHINARFDGVIERVYVGVGDRVSAGAPLLQIESNEGLNRYTVNSPVSGLVTARDANTGEQTAGKGLLTIVDSSSVWADLMISQTDLSRISPLINSDTQVSISVPASDEIYQGAIRMLLPQVQSNQAITARVELDNSSGRLVPGSWLTAQIPVGNFDVPLAVRREALQMFQNSTVVYVQSGDEFEVRVVQTGRQAGDWVEVVSGLSAGTSYVAGNSFIVKADIEKAGAGHDH